MNKILHFLWSSFSSIVTGITCVATVFILTFWGTKVSLGVEILWQILLVSAICSLGSLILYNENNEFSKKQMLFRLCLLFAYVDIITLGFGYYFHWFYFSSWRMVAGMELCVIAVFVGTIYISSLTAQKEADTINAKLREREH